MSLLIVNDDDFSGWYLWT